MIDRKMRKASLLQGGARAAAAEALRENQRRTHPYELLFLDAVAVTRKF